MALSAAPLASGGLGGAGLGGAMPNMGAGGMSGGGVMAPGPAVPGPLPEVRQRRRKKEKREMLVAGMAGDALDVLAAAARQVMVDGEEKEGRPAGTVDTMAFDDEAEYQTWLSEGKEWRSSLSKAAGRHEKVADGPFVVVEWGPFETYVPLPAKALADAMRKAVREARERADRAAAGGGGGGGGEGGGGGGGGKRGGGVHISRKALRAAGLGRGAGSGCCDDDHGPGGAAGRSGGGGGGGLGGNSSDKI